jgi:hypothetical protein
MGEWLEVMRSLGARVVGVDLPELDAWNAAVAKVISAEAAAAAMHGAWPRTRPHDCSEPSERPICTCARRRTESPERPQSAAVGAVCPLDFGAGWMDRSRWEDPVIVMFMHRLSAMAALGVLPAVLFVGGASLAQAQDGRVVQTVALPSGAHVVVAEGDREPRSIGSYALRLYAKGEPSFPADAYVAGAIRARDGSIERVLVEDVDRDGRPEVVVLVRSAGTGGHQQADAFAIGARRVSLRASVSKLAKDADPVAALRARLRAKPGG